MELTLLTPIGSLIVAIIAVGVSSWSAWNSSRALKLSKDNNRRTIEVAEFNKVRAPVDTALADMDEHIADLHSLSASASNKIALTKTVVDINKGLAKTNNTLKLALRQLDKSTFASRDDWTTDHEGKFEQVTLHIDGIYSPTITLAQMKESIARAGRELDDAVSCIRSRIEQEVRKISAV